MARRGTGGDPRLRQRFLWEAARLLAEGEAADFPAARRKALQRLGIVHLRPQPDNTEIEATLQEYQRLFRADSQPTHLYRLRETALRAMQLLSRFDPRLVGPVLTGSADRHSPVHLHLFAEHPEAVALFLLEQRIPFEQDERRVRFDQERIEHYPLYRFEAGGTTLELTVFPVIGLRQAPLSPVDQRPMRRADAAMVERLLQEAVQNPGG